MAYATAQDLIDRFGERELVQLTDRATPPAGVIDQVVVDRALGDAAELIDGYVGKVYALPLITSPKLLVDLTAQIARYRLHREPTEKVRYDYEDAVKRLKEIAAGTLTLPGEGGVKPPAAPGVILMTGEPREFTRSKMSGL